MTTNPISSIPPFGPMAGTTPPPGSGRFKPIDPLLVLRRHLWALIGLVMLGMVAGGATWYVMHRHMPRYTSEAPLEVMPRNPSAWTGLSSDIGDLPMDLIAAAKRNEIALLKSEQVLREALNRPMVRDSRWIDQFTRMQNGESSLDVHAALDALQNDVISASPGTPSNVLSVTATTRYPEDARNILQTVLDVYLSEVRTEREGQSRGVRNLYRAERDDANQQIERVRSRIAEFEQDTDMGRLRAMLDETATSFQKHAEQRNDLQVALHQAQQSLDSLIKAQDTGTIEPDAATTQEIEAHQAIQELDRDLRLLRRDKQALLADFGPNHYRMQRIADRIEVTMSQRRVEFERLAREQQAAQLERTAETVAQIKSRLARLASDLDRINQRRSDLYDQLRTRESELQVLQEQLAHAKRNRDRAQESLDTVDVQSRHPAAVSVTLIAGPSRATLTSPKKTIIIPAVALLVIGVGTGGLFLKETLDQRLRSPADVRLLGETDLLGVLPNVEEDPTCTRRIEGAVRRHPTGLIADSYRQVRTALLNKMDRRDYKTLLLAGAQPGNGASSIAHNLACSLACHGRDILLIDANLRRPAQHELTAVAQYPGLIELLQQEIIPEQAIIELEDMPLSVLPAGDLHAASPELLASSALPELLRELEPRYDTIVLDVAPALLASDAQLLARHVDALALIVRADRDTRGMIEHMLRRLGGQHADVLGLILNDARPSTEGYFRQSYHEYYRYSPNGHRANNGHQPPQRKVGRAVVPEEAEQTEHA